MEPITIATIGATAMAFTRRSSVKTAFWVGALGGFLPDADVLIRSSSDPLLHLEYHRHFTHSLFFIPIGGLIAAGIARIFSKGKRTWKDLWLPATLGWATHGLLDSCTSYGTHLLWPFSDVRVAWHNVSIVDPIYTLPLICLALLSLRTQMRRFSRVALLWSCVYLLLGVHQRNKAHEVYLDVIDKRAHHPTEISVKLSFGNNILFRGFYIEGDRFYADAVRVPWFGDTKIYEGTSIERLNYTKMYEQMDSTHRFDMDRFHFFSNGFLVEDPVNPGVVGDFRYAMIPNAVAPMWGIDVGNRQPNIHMSFLRFTKLSAVDRQEFWRQLMGR